MDGCPKACTGLMQGRLPQAHGAAGSAPLGYSCPLHRAQTRQGRSGLHTRRAGRRGGQRACEWRLLRISPASHRSCYPTACEATCTSMANPLAYMEHVMVWQRALSGASPHGCHVGRSLGMTLACHRLRECPISCSRAEGSRGYTPWKIERVPPAYAYPAGVAGRRAGRQAGRQVGWLDAADEAAGQRGSRVAGPPLCCPWVQVSCSSPAQRQPTKGKAPRIHPNSAARRPNSSDTFLQAGTATATGAGLTASKD
jgi:hypothetical protein